MTDLEAQVRELATRVRHLEDVLALTQLVSSYGPAVDNGDSERTAALWDDDGVYACEPVGSWTGREAIAGMVDGPLHQRLIADGCAHVLTTPQIVVHGDTAEGWNHSLNIRYSPADDRFWVARVAANHWRWRRTATGWVTVDRTNRNLDGAATARELFAAPPDALS